MEKDELLVKMLEANMKILNIYRQAIGQTSFSVREQTLKPAVNLLFEFKDYLEELKAITKASQ